MLHKVITVQGLQSRRAREAEPRSDVECLHPSSPTSMSTGLVWWNLLLPFCCTGKWGSTSAEARRCFWLLVLTLQPHCDTILTTLPFTACQITNRSNFQSYCAFVLVSCSGTLSVASMHSCKGTFKHFWKRLLTREGFSVLDILLGSVFKNLSESHISSNFKTGNLWSIEFSYI